MTEAQLFSASVAPFGLVPIFFSGCPIACDQASAKIPGIRCHPIDKTGDRKNFDPIIWRRALAMEAVKSLNAERKDVYFPEGAFEATIEMRDGPGIAEKIAKRWGLKSHEDNIFINADDIEGLYHALIRMCYFTPLIEKVLPVGLPLFNLRGRAGLWWGIKKVEF